MLAVDKIPDDSSELLASSELLELFDLDFDPLPLELPELLPLELPDPLLLELDLPSRRRSELPDPLPLELPDPLLELFDFDLLPLELPEPPPLEPSALSDVPYSGVP